MARYWPKKLKLALATPSARPALGSIGDPHKSEMSGKVTGAVLDAFDAENAEWVKNSAARQIRSAPI